MQINAGQYRSMPIIVDQCQINYPWSGIDWNWSELIRIDWHWSAMIGIHRHWDQCCNFDRHWSASGNHTYPVDCIFLETPILWSTSEISKKFPWIYRISQSSRHPRSPRFTRNYQIYRSSRDSRHPRSPRFTRNFLGYIWDLGILDIQDFRNLRYIGEIRSLVCLRGLGVIGGLGDLGGLGGIGNHGGIRDLGDIG